MNETLVARSPSNCDHQEFKYTPCNFHNCKLCGYASGIIAFRPDSKNDQKIFVDIVLSLCFLHFVVSFGSLFWTCANRAMLPLAYPTPCSYESYTTLPGTFDH